jgi:hypothetical protein
VLPHDVAGPLPVLLPALLPVVPLGVLPVVLPVGNRQHGLTPATVISVDVRIT